ncbi:hypothetical protein ACQPWW_20655 [Micromonospora sp. CA-240977]|uniref:hypothetical protein n=1 Tax=Micromonospora sp. CA-240977 TaxID=3239957 RepID=UPI003D906A7E
MTRMRRVAEAPINRHHDLTELVGAVLGSAVGGVAGWVFGGGGGYVGWVGATLAAYFLGLGPIVVAIEHVRGVLRGLGVAVLRVAWSVAGVAVLAVPLILVAMPLAVVQVTPAGGWLLERFPNATNGLVQGVLVAVTVAILGLLARTAVGLAVLGFAFEGIGKGAFMIGPVWWLVLTALPTYPIVLLIVWLLGWPDGWIGGLVGLTLGAAVGGFHGYRSAGEVSIDAGLDW